MRTPAPCLDPDTGGWRAPRLHRIPPYARTRADVAKLTEATGLRSGDELLRPDGAARLNEGPIRLGARTGPPIPTVYNGTLSNNPFQRKQEIYGESNLQMNKALVEND